MRTGKCQHQDADCDLRSDDLLVNTSCQTTDMHIDNIKQHDHDLTDMRRPHQVSQIMIMLAYDLRLPHEVTNQGACFTVSLLLQLVLLECAVSAETARGAVTQGMKAYLQILQPLLQAFPVCH